MRRGSRYVAGTMLLRVATSLNLIVVVRDIVEHELISIQDSARVILRRRGLVVSRRGLLLQASLGAVMHVCMRVLSGWRKRLLLLRIVDVDMWRHLVGCGGMIVLAAWMMCVR